MRGYLTLGRTLLSMSKDWSPRPLHRRDWSRWGRYCTCGSRWPCLDRKTPTTRQVPRHARTAVVARHRYTPPVGTDRNSRFTTYPGRSNRAPRNRPAITPPPSAPRSQVVGARQNASHTVPKSRNGWPALPYPINTPRWNAPTETLWVGRSALLTPGQARRGSPSSPALWRVPVQRIGCRQPGRPVDLPVREAFHRRR